MGKLPFDLHLIFEKSSCKNQVRQTWFLAYKNQFRNWFLHAGSKNPVQNRLKIQFFKLNFSKLIFQKSSSDQQRESCLLLEFFKKSDCRNQMALECIQNNAHKSSQLSLLSLLICTLISENQDLEKSSSMYFKT